MSLSVAAKPADNASKADAKEDGGEKEIEYKTKADALKALFDFCDSNKAIFCECLHHSSLILGRTASS